MLLPPVGSTPSRTGGFLGTTSPGPMAELYGAANQDSGVSSYISAASPAPSTGFGHSLGVSAVGGRGSTGRARAREEEEEGPGQLLALGERCFLGSRQLLWMTSKDSCAEGVWKLGQFS